MNMNAIVKQYQEKLMADPERYVQLLREQNMLHCVWHIELQQKIAALEAENQSLREEPLAR